ncbi:MAG: glycosyltransferase family 4 protein [Syntrophobacterales bacterium]|nr:glycosyltransferase family 4 protein [Syntrophobacterales bacterium]
MAQEEGLIQKQKLAMSDVRKRIAIFDHVGKKAGMDYYDSSLLKGFLHAGHEGYVFSNFSGLDAEHINYIPVYDGHSNANGLVKGLRLLFGTLRAAQLARKEKIDLVILHLFSANVVTLVLSAIPKLFGLKTAVISHDISSFAGNDSVAAVQGLIYNTLSDYIIVHNRFSYKTLMSNIKIKETNKVHVIKHGGYLDYVEQKIDKKEARRQLGLEEHARYILFFGQIKKVKGLDIVLEAMPDVDNNIHLIIAGKLWKDDFSYYDEIIKKHHLEDRIVKQVRFIKDDEREKYFIAADVNVLPYRTIYQSGVLLMAMSYGLPVIASDLPANKEIIADKKNGLLFQSENSLKLSEQISRYFNDDSLRDTISRNSIETIERNYNWDDIARAYLDIISNHRGDRE